MNKHSSPTDDDVNLVLGVRRLFLRGHRECDHLRYLFTPLIRLADHAGIIRIRSSISFTDPALWAAALPTLRLSYAEPEPSCLSPGDPTVGLIGISSDFTPR